jgi:hypothetical protein
MKRMERLPILLRTILLNLEASLKNLCGNYSLQKEIEKIELPININMKYDKENKLFFAKAEEYPGIYAWGKPNTIIEAVNDAIYMYFGVERAAAKRMRSYVKPPKEVIEDLNLVETKKKNFAKRITFAKA